MRILFLDTSVTYGGGQEALLSLVDGMRSKDHRVLVLATGRGRLAVRLTEAGVEWKPWGLRSKERMARGYGGSEFLGIPLGIRDLLRVMDQWGPDLLHANSERAALVCALLPRARRKPFVFHDRTLEERRGLIPWIGRRSDAVIAISSAVSVKHRRKGRGSHVRIVPDGIDLGRFSPLPPRSAPGPKVFAVVGRLSHEKGHRIFVNAALEFLEAGGEAEFVLCGNWTTGGGSDFERRILARFENRPAAKRIRVLGFQEDVAEFLEKTDVMVVPSLREGFGIAAVEALARGRPVIASRVGGLPEIVQHGRNGLLFEAGNVSQLAAAMRSIVDDPELYGRLAALAPSSVRRFSAEETIRSIHEAYRAVLLPSTGPSERRVPETPC
ncbi:MAG: glycosyltransferase family 4 protein [Candidatus Eisenbacteria bacterium]